MDDLPDEILHEIARLLNARSLCALQRISSRFNRIARDPPLWRNLFAHDFVALFHAPRAWEPYAPPTCDDWPPEARLLYRQTGCDVALPLPSHPETGLPPPLARAFTVGKDWRWVYHACAVALQRKGKKRCLSVGSVVGSRGYGASIKLCKAGTRVTQWTEHGPGWCVRHAAHSLKCDFDHLSYMRTTDDRRLWDVRGPHAAVAIPSLEGAVTITIQKTDETSYTVRGHHTFPQRPVVRTCYANGDVQVTLGVIDPVGVEFVCSSRCAEMRFAARTFVGPWTVLAHPDFDNGPAILLPASSNHDAPAFWHYVLMGLVGWTDEERCRALDHVGLPCPPRGISFAVADALLAASPLVSAPRSH